MRLVERARRICLALPEANEKISHGEPTWFAGTGKVFAMLDDHHHGAEHLALWLPLPPGAQETLVASDPERYFRPPYVGHRGWVGVVLVRPEWRVAGLVEEAYRHVAAKRLVAAGATRSRPPQGLHCDTKSCRMPDVPAQQQRGTPSAFRRTARPEKAHAIPPGLSILGVALSLASARRRRAVVGRHLRQRHELDQSHSLPLT
jgi:hypothetical protein